MQLVGAVDPKRVTLIIPIVLDAINFIQFSHHQWKAYGGWSFALADYTDMNIMARIDDPNMLLLAEQVRLSFARLFIVRLCGCVLGRGRISI